VIVFTWQSLQQVDNEQALTRNEHALTREGQVTDRYNAAVGNIGEDSLEVRLGGIYALQRIMEDSTRDQPAIVNVLSTYIRNHAKKPKPGTDASKEPPSDVQAALTALGGRNPTHDGTARIDLHGSYLRGAHLPFAALTDANLDGADLLDVNLVGADLRGADLDGADLRRAILDTANLRGTHLNSADLSEARLTEAHLAGADLTSADLSGADLAFAYLRNADLTDADLRNADLDGADLRNAKR
jgi:uncharacterized protein YjbI with pentapeptide repeats